MQFIERVRGRFRSSNTQLRRLKAAGGYIMRHIGMTGRIEGLATRDAEGRTGVMLVIQTAQHVPSVAREEIQQYFRRKLDELGELRGKPFRLLIRDGDDLSLARRAQTENSSARIASVIAAANHDNVAERQAAQLVGMRMAVRQRLSERRQEREQTDYAPLAPLTDIGGLPEP